MRKILFLFSLLLVLSTSLIMMAHLTIKYHLQTISWIAPATDEEQWEAKRRGTPRLTTTEIQETCRQLQEQTNKLNKGKWIFVGISLLLAMMITGILISGKNKMSRFDGLALLVAGIALISIHFVFEWFMENFENSHNPTINFRLSVELTILLMWPFLFYAAYRMNNTELTSNLHTHRWISKLAIVFCIISSLLLVVIGIGLLATPDLSGNIT